MIILERLELWSCASVAPHILERIGFGATSHTLLIPYYSTVNKVLLVMRVKRHTKL